MSRTAATQIQDQDDEATKAAAAAAAEAEDKDEAQVEESEAPDADADSPEDIARARRSGWVPESEFRGDRKPRIFLSAAQFLAREKEDGKIAIERSRHLDDKLSKTEKELAATRSEVGEIRELLVKTHEQTVAANKRAYDRGRAEVVAERDAAIDQGDRAAVHRADAKIAEFDKTKPEEAPARREPEPAKPVAPAQVTFDEVVAKLDTDTQGFIRENRSWYEKSGVLQRAMIDEHYEVMADSPELSRREQLDEAKRRVMGRYPEKFGVNPARAAPGSVSRPNPPPRRSSSKKSFDDLPDDAKAAYKAMEPSLTAKQTKTAGKPTPYTKDQYLADYEWE